MIEYRKATIEDADLLAKIRVDFLCEVNGVDTDEEKDLLTKTNWEYIYKSLQNDTFAVWIAIEDGRVVGTSGASFYQFPPNRKCPEGKVAYISNMFTYKECRGKGIASELFRLIVDEIKNRGYECAFLNATDMGKPIYEKYGFNLIANDMNYYFKWK